MGMGSKKNKKTGINLNKPAKLTKKESKKMDDSLMRLQKSLRNLKKVLEDGFAKMNAGFDMMDRHFDRINATIDRMEQGNKDIIRLICTNNINEYNESIEETNLHE